MPIASIPTRRCDHHLALDFWKLTCSSAACWRRSTRARRDAANRRSVPRSSYGQLDLHRRLVWKTRAESHGA